MVYISSQAELIDLIGHLKGASVLAIDTEFLREKSYYAKLCLLQLATDDIQAIVDPFSVDITALADCLTDTTLMKVFHAGDQDREILFHEVGVAATPVFDTQVAASLLGHSQQIGYGALVNALCNVVLPKADSFTDWAQRPLSEAQLKYAIDDVLYLPGIYRQMKADLEAAGRESWLDEDFAAMTDESLYTVVPEERWRHLKRSSSLSRRQLAIARELAAWRERKAQANDIPRKWILTDEMLVEICKREPKTAERAFEVRGVREKLTSRQVTEVVTLVQQALATPADSWPTRPTHRYNESDYDGPVDLMSALLHLRARENAISAPLLASHSELVQVAAGEREGVRVLSGWRYEMLGRELLRLLEGRVTLALDQGTLHVSETEA